MAKDYDGIDPKFAHNVVNVGPKGTLKKSGNIFTNPQHLKNIAKKIEKQHKDEDEPVRVLFHFHGGLVNEKAGLEVVTTLNDELNKKANKYKKDLPYPIYYVWEAGFLETLIPNLDNLLSSPSGREVLVEALKLVLKALPKNQITNILKYLVRLKWQVKKFRPHLSQYGLELKPSILEQYWQASIYKEFISENNIKSISESDDSSEWSNAMSFFGISESANQKLNNLSNLEELEIISMQQSYGINNRLLGHDPNIDAYSMEKRKESVTQNNVGHDLSALLLAFRGLENADYNADGWGKREVELRQLLSLQQNLCDDDISSFGDDAILEKLTKTFKFPNSLINSPSNFAVRGFGGLIKIDISKITGVVANIVLRFVNRTHHAFATIIEELIDGGLISELIEFGWGQMDLKAKNMWLESSGIDIRAGWLMMEELIQLKNKGEKIEISFTAHSTGAINVCHFLDYFVENWEKFENKITIKNIIFLAPASNIELFNETIIQYSQLLNFNFRMFTMKDNFEMADIAFRIPGTSKFNIDPLMRFIYPASMLYFVSGVAEEGSTDTPIIGLQRFLNKGSIYQNPKYNYPECIKADKWLKIKSRVFYSKTGRKANNGERSTAIQHGDFDNNSDTLNSIAYMLTHYIP